MNVLPHPRDGKTRIQCESSARLFADGSPPAKLSTQQDVDGKRCKQM